MLRTAVRRLVRPASLRVASLSTFQSLDVPATAGGVIAVHMTTRVFFLCFFSERNNNNDFLLLTSSHELCFTLC
jgi:hypothetical protein